MRNEEFAIYAFPCGNLKIGYTGTAIRHILFTDEKAGGTPSKLSELAAKQLREYFDGTRKSFDLPLDAQGTEFQKKVWEALLEIPYGETKSYKDIAERAGSPRGFRAVGGANHNNPISIVIPCHRVIASDGGLGGYGGGLGTKTLLLELERKFR
ncbi:MAG: methylated-DNA--[protein]-cysteine S-methyltransferase [Oscillospiraceae bacterium]|nr:methylated-DNA--[protein]-cysteine S-methyltransferase [Oscillospiraceae bacterium]